MTKLQKRSTSPLRFVSPCLILAVLAASPIASANAGDTPLAAAPSVEALPSFAMRWFTEMLAGRTDQSLYAPDFAPQVTDAAIASMSGSLNRYGAQPLRAEIVRSGKDGGQTFYTVKFVFPRGDATSLLFGFDVAGKITGVAVGGMAGD